MNKIFTLLSGIVLSAMISANVSAQTGYEVKGVVSDAIGPIVGASVLEIVTPPTEL